MSVPAATPADLRESDARGETAAIFADIRAVQRSGNVNYIWRHLATIPGALETAWHRVRPRHAEVHEAGEAIWLRAEELVEACGSAPAACDLIPEAGRAVLDSYARGNRWNLAALTLLLTGELPRGPAVGSTKAGTAAFPPLPAFDALPERIRQAVAVLANAGPAADSGIRPSLWVHLGLWPAQLTALERDLPGLLRSEAFRRNHAELLRFCGHPAAHDAALPAAAITSLNRFRRRIAEMTLIGAILQPRTAAWSVGPKSSIVHGGPKRH